MHVQSCCFAHIINCLLTLSLQSSSWLLQLPIVVLCVELVLAFILYLSDFVKTWPLGFRLAPGTARLQASPVCKKSRGLDVLVGTAG